MNVSRHSDERGLALITVVVATTILSLLATALIAYGVSSQNVSRHDQEWNAALAAAEAGIDDYLFRLNENDLYYTYDAGNPPPDGNLAFGQYVQVAGGSTNSEYRYDVDKSQLNTEGKIILRSTGRVGDTERTVNAGVRRRSFLDYLYYTEYETKDPDAYNTSLDDYDKTTAGQRCPLHYYGNASTVAGVYTRRDVVNRVDYPGDSDSANCTDINFATVDTVNGPLHTDDAFLVCGSPNFMGKTTTAFPGEGNPLRLYRLNTGCSGNSPDFVSPYPQPDTDLDMPPTNQVLKIETNATTPANQGGCLYTGPTRIRLNPGSSSNNNGTMTVKSPYSKQTNNNCPTNGTGPLPLNGVIYVQSVPTASSDPNYWGTTACPNSTYNSTTNVWGSASGSYSSPSHPLGYPITIGSSIDQNVDGEYGCRLGDVFLEGTLDGQLTIAAQNNIVITRDTTFEGGLGGDDLLGLIAEQYVEIYHPVDCTSASASCEMDSDIPSRARFNGSDHSPTTEPDSSWDRGVFGDADVHAAILSLKHSFRVQHYRYGDDGALGQLHVRGAIAQRFRGIVGTINTTGFAKDYVYDNRLKYLSPPKFLDPIKVGWGVATWAEIDTPAAYQ
jgi:hypothetical protein